jgi:hypothetical protein
MKEHALVAASHWLPVRFPSVDDPLDASGILKVCRGRMLPSARPLMQQLIASGIFALGSTGHVA